MLQILCSSVRVKLLPRDKLGFLREQLDDFFSVGNSANLHHFRLGTFHITRSHIGFETFDIISGISRGELPTPHPGSFQ